MKLWEALKIHEETGRKIRPVKLLKSGAQAYDFAPVKDWFEEGWIELPCDWEVESPKVEVSRDQIRAALFKFIKAHRNSPLYKSDEEIADFFWSEISK